MLENLGLDDVVGAIPVHMFAGIFGTLVVLYNFKISLKFTSNTFTSAGSNWVSEHLLVPLSTTA